MKSAVETLSPTRAKLTVEVPFEELKPSLDAAYQKIAKQINVPGFRRGKVPPAVIDRQVGRGPVLDEAINAVVPQQYMAALQEHDLEPLAQPEIEVTKFEDNESLEFTAEVDVKPDFELPSYDGLEASVEDIEISDADVDEQVEALRERFGTLVPVERAAADGDFVTIDLVAAKDGETVEGGEVTGMSYKVGRGGMIDGLDEALVGLQRRRRRDLRLRARRWRPGRRARAGDRQGHRRAGAAAPRVRRRVRPARLRVRHRRGAHRRRARAPRPRQAPRAGRRRARRRPRGPPREGRDPAPRGDGHRRAQRPSPERRAAARAWPASPWRSTSRTRARPRRSSRPTSSAGSATPSPPSSSSTRSPRRRSSASTRPSSPSTSCAAPSSPGQDPQEFANHMFEHNHIPELVQEILRGKALATIVESATVTDASGNVVELKNLRPDGTIGEPVEEAAAEAADEAEERRRRGRPEATRPDLPAPPHGRRPPSGGRRSSSGRPRDLAQRCPRCRPRRPRA